MGIIKKSLQKTTIFFLIFFSGAFLQGADIHEKVLICGVCRNVATRLEKTKEIMETIGNLFEDYRIIVYENNSTDRTPFILQEWAKSNPKVFVKSENLSPQELGKIIVNINADGSFFVPEQIARARNVVLDQALLPAYSDFPYLIWMDMDFVLMPDFEGFIDTFQSSQEWDGVFAYGIESNNNFWDWYALRDLNYPIGSELLGMEWWNMPKKLTFSKDDPWYPVYSAFGGCGIYKKASIKGCRYSALVTNDQENYTKTLLASNIDHPLICKYLYLNKKLQHIFTIDKPQTHSPRIRNPKVGIVLSRGPNPVIWRMSTHVYQYPSVCEHVPFHASMIIRGHDKLFINPKLVFRYGD